MIKKCKTCVCLHRFINYKYKRLVSCRRRKENGGRWKRGEKEEEEPSVDTPYFWYVVRKSLCSLCPSTFVLLCLISASSNMTPASPSALSPSLWFPPTLSSGPSTESLRSSSSRCLCVFVCLCACLCAVITPNRDLDHAAQFLCISHRDLAKSGLETRIRWGLGVTTSCPHTS